MNQPSLPDFLVVGRIGRAHGIQGEVSVDVLTDFPERFGVGETLYIGPVSGPSPEPVTILSARPHRDRLLLRFDLSEDRDLAQQLTGQFLYIPADEARPLDPDTFYPHQLLGLEVITADGEILGKVRELMETGAADVLIVQGAERTVLLPMIADVISEVDLAGGRIVVTPLPGLLD
jgi:16S rRNA processing protein RimM